MANIYDTDLPRTEANFAPFTPLAFIQRTAEVYPDKLAIVHGELRQNWAQTYDRCFGVPAGFAAIALVSWFDRGARVRGERGDAGVAGGSL